MENNQLVAKEGKAASSAGMARRKVCEENNIQWEDRILALSDTEFSAYVGRRLRIRSKLGK